MYESETEKVLREYQITKEQRESLRDRDYSPVSYIDYYPDGKVVKGEEDFSLLRFGSLVARYVYVPNGEKDKGGHRRWECVREIRSRSARECGMIARRLFKDVEISVRQY